MLPKYDDFLIKRFEQPDKVRTFEKGKFETTGSAIASFAIMSHPSSKRFRGQIPLGNRQSQP